MKTGTVKWYNDERGYGFITPDAGGADIIVHHTGIAQGKKIKEGQRVSYTVLQTPKGDEAVDVSPL